MNWESDEIRSKLLRDIDSKTKEISNLIQEIKETWDSKWLIEEELKREIELWEQREKQALIDSKS